MNMQFRMESGDSLAIHGKKTASESDDLGQLVRQLAQAGEPLEGTFNGPAKAAFARFALNADDIATRLNNALVTLTESVAGQHVAMTQGTEEAMAAHTRNEGSADFAGAEVRFSYRA